MEKQNINLIKAARAGNLSLAESSLANGADVNTNTEGFKPIIIASALGNENMVKLLLEAGADVNLKSNNDAIALIEASKHGYVNIVKLLLQFGALPDSTFDEETALMKAAECGGHGIKRQISEKECNDIIELLCHYGADIEHKDEYGNTALAKAVARGNLEIVKKLVNYGANVNTQDNYDKTPLCKLLSHSKQDNSNTENMINLLKKYGAK